MSCRDCGALLFPEYGDGDELCAACEVRQEPADVIARDRALQPRPGEPWPAAQGQIGGTGYGLRRTGENRTWGASPPFATTGRDASPGEE